MAKNFGDFGIHIRSGASGIVKTACPKCSKKKSDPCLSVWVSDGTWNCHRCGFTGSLRTGSGDWRSSQNEWARPKGTLLSLRKKSEVGSPISEVGKGEEVISSPLRKFLNDRGIPDEFIEKNNISFAEERWNFVTQKLGPAIAFPYYRKGELVNVKYRGSKKAFSLEAGCELIFWNLDGVVKEGAVVETVYVVEGEMDALAMQVAGYEAVISVPNGAPSEKVKNIEAHLDYIRNSDYKLDGHDEGILEEVKEFVIAVDHDLAGGRLEQALVRRFLPERCRIVSWPDGCKDANDVLLRHGIEGIRSAVEAAKPPPIAGIIRVEDISEEIDRLYTDGLHPGLSLGWEGLTRRDGKELYTIEPGMFTLCTAIPGVGKSAFLEALTVEMAKRYGWRFMMFTPETLPVSYGVSLLAQIYMKLPFADGPHPRMSIEELQYAKEWVNDHYFWVVPEELDYGLDTILAKAEVMIKRYGIQGLVIDPWNNLDVFLPKNMTEVMYLKKCLRTVKLFAVKHGVHIWIAVHPTKLIKNPKTKKYDVIEPYSIMGGSHWYNMADFIFCVHRDKTEGNRDPVEFHFQKVKRRHLGALGVGYLQFDTLTGNYSDVPGLQADDKEAFDEAQSEAVKTMELVKKWHDD